MLRFHPCSSLFSILTWAIFCAPASAAEAMPTKHKVNLPPSAELAYSIKAKQSGLTVDGSTLLKWQAADSRFSIVTETRATLVGKILEAKSEGTVGEYGLAPSAFTEKRFRKPQTTTTFDRHTKTISFTKSDQTYPIKGGEQDRSSAIWQLAAIARAAPAKVKPGSTWTFPVAGTKDADSWTFKVTRQEQVKTPLGDLNAFHIARMPASDDKGQKLELWLAPSLEWYPVRLRFIEPDNDSIEQVLQKITRK
jgi:hypothetical protein